MSILSTNKKLINIGKDYSAGNGIDITNDVISVSGNTVPYSAGENIDIQDFVISGKDWSNDITDASANAFNETTAWVHDNYTNSADVSFLSAEVDKKLDSSAWEAVSGSLATEDYVILSDNLTYARATAFTTAQEYAKESACNSAFDYLNQNKLDVSAFDLPNSGHWNEATNVVETNSAAWFDNVGDAEVNSFVYTNSATINDVDTTYQANSASYLTAHQDISNKLDTTAFSTVSGDFLTAHQSLDGYATEDWVTAQGYVTGVDLSEYAKTSSVLDYIDSACSSKLDTTSFSNVSGDFLTTSFGISESAHWEEATNAYEQASGTYLTSHQDLSDYQTIEGMTAYQPVGDYYSASNPSGFITGVDLTPYATTAEVDTLSSMLSGAIDYVSANAGDEFPASANEAITAYQNASGTYLTAISIPESATWNDVSTTVQTNSATWGQGGGSVTSPLGTISVDGSNIEATNSAVGTLVIPSASVVLGYNVTINPYWWQEPSVFNFNLPISGGTLYVKRNHDYDENQTLNYSGKDFNGNIVTGNMIVSANTGTYTGDLGEIVSNISADADGNGQIRDISEIYVTSPETSADGVHELAWKGEIPTLPDNLFTGYNILSTGGNIYKAAIDTDVRFTANNNTYSLTGVCSTAKELQTALNDSRTIAKSGNYYEIGNIAYKPEIVGISGARYVYTYSDAVWMTFGFNVPTAKLDTIYLTFEATQIGTIDSNWSLYSHSGNQYTFARHLKLMEDARHDYNYNFEFDYGSWGTITNATASATVYNTANIKELAFKDDLTGSQSGVPQSAFDELKQSYDALSSLFATYSGQWLLPNEGV